MIFVAKNINVDDEINYQIQYSLSVDLMTFKSIDITINEKKTVNLPTEHLNSTDMLGKPSQSLHMNNTFSRH